MYALLLSYLYFCPRIREAQLQYLTENLLNTVSTAHPHAIVEMADAKL